MYIISRNNSFNAVKVEKLNNWNFPEGYTATAKFPAVKVTSGDKYDFDVVFSTEAQLSRVFATIASAPVPAPASVLETVSAPTLASKEKGLATLFLKDPSSVDVCFTFSSHKTLSDIGLWAHRCVLSQHESFAKLIQEAKLVQSLGTMILVDKESDTDTDSDSDTESFSNISADGMSTATATTIAGGASVGAASKELIIKVDKVSLATFCTMIYYIYTGEIDRSVDAAHFVFSNTNKATLVWRNSAGKIEDSVGWQPLDQDSPWRLKEVTWKELRDVAVLYDLKDLRTIAAKGLQSTN
ncbi:hypothetical protein BGX33_006671 [Mortierella sp. NVP41]|nr:hypothetical protein BGX33_006671 [Mortierella sp. NVP41]